MPRVMWTSEQGPVELEWVITDRFAIRLTDGGHRDVVGVEVPRFGRMLFYADSLQQVHGRATIELVAPQSESRHPFIG